VKRSLWFLLGCAFLIEPGRLLHALELPAEWKNVQTLQLPRDGLVKISVPLETLSAARPGLEDLRLYDDAGREIPFLMEQSAPSPAIRRPPKQFGVAVSADATVATLETGFTEPIASVTLQTPAPSFLKAVRVDGSQNGRSWEVLVQGQPIFRQQNGVSQLDISIPPARWGFLRITLDDRRAGPIPITGAILHTEAGAPAPEEPLGVVITQRNEEPGTTRLMLRFDGANCVLAGLSLETPDPFFNRTVALSQQRFAEGELREVVVHRDNIQRVAPIGQPAQPSVRFASGVALRQRDLSIVISNDDNPPLRITAVRAWRRPVYLTFNASSVGAIHLLSGNPSGVAPRFDLAFLRASLPDVVLASPQPRRLAANPNHRPVDPLADIVALGPAIPTDRWSFRKPLRLERDGVQRVELDLEVLSHAAPDLRDLRIVRDGRQIPFVLEHPSVEPSFAPFVRKADDARQPWLSRWEIKLPLRSLPISKLTCSIVETYFKRNVRMVETRLDERGQTHTVILGSSTWQRGSGEKPREMRLSVSSRPESDTLFLEIENGDNPPLTLQSVQAWHPAARLIFKSAPVAGTWLYYGNPDAARPQYDLELVVPRLLAADRDEVKPGAEEILRIGARHRGDHQSGWIFWGALALVVAGLLFVLARLVPKPPEQEG
jgi:hypothetical protein